jgi:alkaline phosphatase D
LRIAMVSCQDWQDGFYTAYRHLVDEDVDVVVHLGDYIYEGPARDPDDPAGPRVHDGGETVNLAGYRNRHALYKTDPDLQAAHAAAPWIATFDDHEVDNDWSGDIPEDPENQTTEAFLARRAAAFQAYYEHLPLPSQARPSGPAIRIHRRISLGPLADLHVLDTRQFRSLTEPCGYGTGPACDAVFDPTRTMLGDAQEAWLRDGLDRSDARWNLIAQQVPMMHIDVGANTQELKLDKWDAYPVARQRLLEFLAKRRPANPVVLTGDLHDAWVGDLTLNFDDPDAPVVGTEFIGTSISSDGDGAEASEDGIAAFANGRNPHIHFHHYRRGYTTLDITPTQLTATYRAIPFVSAPDAPINTAARFTVADGEPGAHPD